MQPDGSLVQAVGYRDNGKWVIVGQDSDPGWKIRRWMLFAPVRKTGLGTAKALSRIAGLQVESDSAPISVCLPGGIRLHIRG